MSFTEIQTDAANQYDWSEILTEFNDDGTIAMIQTLYDDGHFIGEVFALTGELSMVIRKLKRLMVHFIAGKSTRPAMTSRPAKSVNVTLSTTTPLNVWKYS